MASPPAYLAKGQRAGGTRSMPWLPPLAARAASQNPRSAGSALTSIVNAGVPQPAAGDQWLRLLFLDATDLHGRQGRAMQFCSRAVVVAMGMNVDGRRELLGLKVGDTESEPLWRDFIGSLID